MKQKKFDIIFLCCTIGVIGLVLGVLAILDSALQLGVNWYGLLIGIAFFIALLIVRELAKIKGFDKDIAYDLLLCLFPFAIIGARLFYAVFSGTSWTFIEFLQIWSGGLSIIGGIIGGFIGILVYALIKKINVFSLTDLVVPVLLLGQAIGRWGNYANQEVYGKIVENASLQWFPMAVNIGGTWHYALFFYESVLNLIAAVVMFVLFKKINRVGYFTSAYLIFYGTVRSIMETQRYEEFILTTNGGLPASQIVSIVFIVLGVILLGFNIYQEIKERKNAKQNNSAGV